MMLRAEDLIKVSVKDNNEPLLSVKLNIPNIIVEPPIDMKSYTSDDVLLRAGVIERLKKAQSYILNINRQYKIVLCYGYRHPTVQQRYFEEQYSVLKTKMPSLTEEELLEEVHKYIALPSVAGHPTGGAVDLTLALNGKLLDMGTFVGEVKKGEKIQVYAMEVSKKNKQNRELLRRVMLQAGFAPFDGEWWHFSYGDREWACYYQKTFAFYEQVIIST